MPARGYWLLKTEPTSFSIDDLARLGTAPWDGVRNYQARNHMRDLMRVGDLALIYHSSAQPTGAVGVGRIVSKARPDPTAWDPSDEHFDPKASPENPIWCLVDVEFVEKFPHFVSLEAMKANPDLAGMMVTRRGMRLSVQPVEKRHFEIVVRMGRRIGQDLQD